MGIKNIHVIRRANFRTLVAEVGGSKAELSRLTGINQTQLSHIDPEDENAEPFRNIGPKTSRTLEAARGKPKFWMDEDHSSAGNGGMEPARVNQPKVRLVSWGQASRGVDGMMSLDFVSGNDAGEYVNAPASVGDGAFALRIRGDSMVNPAGGPLNFPPESIIVVDPTITPMIGYPVVVKLQSAAEAVFKIYAFDGQQYFLKPLNPLYPTVPMPDDAVILGVVISVQSLTLPHLQR